MSLEAIPLYGAPIKKATIARGRELVEAADGGRVPIIFIEPNNTDFLERYVPSTVSTRLKAQALQAAGIDAPVVVLQKGASPQQLADTIAKLQEEGVHGFVFQLPIEDPMAYVLEGVSRDLDLDGTLAGGKRSSSAAEAICRITTTLTTPECTVALVGGGGYVGRAVHRGLDEAGYVVDIIEQGDPEAEAHGSDVIISVTGCAGIITPEITRGSRLVVDAGFSMIVEPDGISFEGDVAGTPLSQYYTPVPGGVGPLNIAVLTERAVQQVTHTSCAVPWNFRIEGVDRKV